MVEPILIIVYGMAIIAQIWEASSDKKRVRVYMAIATMLIISVLSLALDMATQPLK